MNYIQNVIDDLNELIPGYPPELIDLYALLVLTRGKETTLEDVHDAWAIWKNRIKPNHKSLIPFDELKFEIQERDRKFMVAIHTVASR